MADTPETLTMTLDGGPDCQGDVTIKLRPDLAPKHVERIVELANEGFYDGVVFHRVIPGFMVQAGGFTAGMKEKPTRAPIRLESHNGLSNLRGTVAMARTAAPDSATAQFFVNLVDNPALDAAHADDGQGYAVFGTVVSGMEVVDAIASTPTGSHGNQDDVPLKAVVIQHVSVAK